MILIGKRTSSIRYERAESVAATELFRQVQ